VREAGVSVVDLTITPTPLMYFATAHWKLDGGANITGSHNPIEYNGVKMVYAGAAPLSEDEIPVPPAVDRGATSSRARAGSRRARLARTTTRPSSGAWRPARRLKVVVDAGNGVAGTYAPELLRRLGCEVSSSFASSRTGAPQPPARPEDPEDDARPPGEGAGGGRDLGIAYDGDADRVGVVDERGRRHEADLILVLLARDLLSRHPGAQIVFDVKSSQSPHRRHPRARRRAGHVEDRPLPPQAEDARGPDPARGRGQRPHVLRENYYGVDDGILASCKVIELARARGSRCRGCSTRAAPGGHPRAQGNVSGRRKSSGSSPS